MNGPPCSVCGCVHHHHHQQMAEGLLSRTERWWLGLRLVAALAAGGLVLVTLAVRAWRPQEPELADILAAIAAALVAAPVLSAAVRSLARPGLAGATSLLVALALIAAWAIGDLMTAALIPLALVLGHAIEERSLMGTRESLAALSRLLRSRARRQSAEGVSEEIDADALRPGDRFELRPGDRVPADGCIVSGRSCVDSAPITGESIPQEVGPGDRLLAGSLNQGGHLVVLVEHGSTHSALGAVIALMQDAVRTKPVLVRVFDRFAGAYLVLVVVLAGLVGLAGGSAQAMMATLVAACPCALVVAVPATAIAAIAAAARTGILVKSPAFLEHLATCDSVLLDKTGTLTEGRLRVLDGEVLTEAWRRRLAALAQTSSHPVAQACARLAEGEMPAVSEVAETTGGGLSGTVEGHRLQLGRQGFLQAELPSPPVHGGPMVGLLGDGAFLAWLRLEDTRRPEAVTALTQLRQLGLVRQVLLTGDRRTVAEQVASGLGLDEIEAEALPAAKLARVQQELARGQRPLVVGDGINDTLALKAGAVGVAIGGRSADAALASADLVLVDGDLRRLVSAVRLSRRCRRSILASLAIAGTSTTVVVSLAACGLLSPFAAVLLHHLGTAAVILNAGRLLRHPPADDEVKQESCP